MWGAEDRIAAAALYAAPLRAVLHSPAPRPSAPSDTIRVSLMDQRSTGLCWLFCGMALMQARYRAEFPEESTHPFYPDIVHLYRLHLKGRVRVFFKLLAAAQDEDAKRGILEAPLDDGGSFGMLRHLVAQHGVPLLAEPRSLPYSAIKSGPMMQYLRHMLRRADASASATVNDADRVIDRCLGTLCGSATTWRPALAYEVIVHAPDRPPGWLSGFWSNDPLTLVQDPALATQKVEDVLDACQRELDARRPVWATFCVGLDFDHANGYAGAAASGVLPPLRSADKAARMRLRDMAPNHAMLIVGRATDGAHWFLHNSWGKRGAAARVHTADDRRAELVVVTDEWFRANIFHVAHLPAAASSSTPVLRVLSWHDVLSTVAREGPSCGFPARSRGRQQP